MLESAASRLRPSGVPGVLAALLLVVGLLVGCSHRTPYLRETAGGLGPGEASGRLLSRVLLIGDAGDPGASVLDDVARWAAMAPPETLVAYLGDNMYPEGMTPSRAAEAPTRLLPQIAAAREAGARALFVPGNHDWADGKDGGYEAVRAQGRYVREEVGSAQAFLPRDGCPGPASLDELEGIRIVVLDTQWWLHAGPRPTGPCTLTNAAEVLGALSESLRTDRHVIVLAHHPLFGYGRHVGFSEWREHVYFPLAGTLAALVRKLAPRRQDYGSEAYREMTSAFRSVLDGPESGGGLRIWAAGHEHNLQVLAGHAVDYVLISGAGARTTPVTHGEETLFAHSHPGFMVLDLMETGAVTLRVVEPEVGVVFGLELKGPGAI